MEPQEHQVVQRKESLRHQRNAEPRQVAQEVSMLAKQTAGLPSCAIQQSLEYLWAIQHTSKWSVEGL